MGSSALPAEIMGRPLPPSCLRLQPVDRLRRQIDGTLPSPPTRYLTGLRLEDVGEGRTEFSMPCSDWWLGDSGFDWWSAAAFLADAPLGCAVLSSLGPCRATPTAELSIVYMDPPPTAEQLRASGTLVAVDDRTGLSRAEVVADAGRLVAMATTRVLVVDAGVAFEEPSPESGALPAPIDTGPPAGLEAPPVDLLLGLSWQVSARGIQATMAVSGWYASPSHTVYGGVLAAAAQRCAHLASSAFAREGQSRPLDLKVNYFRPVVPVPSTLSIEAELLRAGRSVHVAEVRVAGPDERAVVHAVSTIWAGET